MGAAIGWGALAASSLVIGAAIGLARPWPRRLVGLVLGFGAGALISAVSFELVRGGSAGWRRGSPSRSGSRWALSPTSSRPAGSRRWAAAAALALGAFLDGIPEQMVLGIGLASGEPVSAGLLAAIFVSNLPEAIGGATDMKREMHASQARDAQLGSWIAGFCALATVVGYAIADSPRTSCRPASTASPPAP